MTDHKASEPLPTNAPRSITEPRSEANKRSPIYCNAGIIQPCTYPECSCTTEAGEQSFIKWVGDYIDLCRKYKSELADANAAVRDLSAKLEVERKANGCPIGLDATPKLCSAASCRHCLIDRLGVERKAREKAKARVAELMRNIEASDEDCARAEANAATIFERTREKMKEQLCETCRQKF